MNKTPRTDKAWNQGYYPDCAVNGISKDFAEKLERELNEMADLMTHRMNQRDEAEKEVSELREALRKTILWAECCQLDKSKYPDGINWDYLNDGRAALLKSQVKADSCDTKKPEYRLVTVDGFDLTLRRIIIKYGKKEPMPMVSIGDTMLVAWKQDKEEI